MRGGRDLKKVFESDRICFVEISELFINDYLKMLNDYENVSRFFADAGRNYTAEDEIAWIRKKREEKADVFSIVEKKTGAFIGNIELMGVSDTERELGIVITAEKQNTGYGTEAVCALVKYGFERKGLQKIVLRTNPANGRAIHVYKKCGFTEYDRNDEHIFMELFR